MIKFDNKLELRYYFNDKSNYMDAMIKHRSEKEVLLACSDVSRHVGYQNDCLLRVFCLTGGLSRNLVGGR